MARILSRNTKPELIVRSLLHSLGYRFRLHYKQLLGKPDIVLPKYHLALFVHGCFWHQHKNCKKQAIPKSNKGYWEPKLQGNIEKQKRDIEILKKQNWQVYKIWECQTKDEDKLTQKILKIL